MAEIVIVEEVVREYWTDGEKTHVYVGVQATNKSLKDKVGICGQDIEYVSDPQPHIDAFIPYARQEIVNAANALDNGMRYE